jgi:hypothetical protein
MVRFPTSRSRPTFGWSPVQRTGSTVPIVRGHMARAGPYHRGGWGLPASAATGKPMGGGGGVSVSTVRAACQASASADVTAVTSCSLSTPSFFGHRVDRADRHGCRPSRPRGGIPHFGSSGLGPLTTRPQREWFCPKTTSVVQIIAIDGLIEDNGA